MDAHAAELLDKTVRERVSEEVSCRTKIIHEEAASGVLDLAEEEKADLIVIATHGRSGWRRFLFGSVAAKVVRYAVCPVLTIRPQKAD